jgi:hypothetical protein
LILLNRKISIIRNREGRFNFSTLERGKRKTENRPEKAEKKNRRAPPASLIAVVDVSAGVHYVDQKGGRFSRQPDRISK